MRVIGCRVSNAIMCNKIQISLRLLPAPHGIHSCIIFMRLIFKSRRETPIKNRDQKFIFISFSDFNNFEIQRQLPSYLHNLIVSRFSQSIGLILYEINLCIVVFQFFKLISCLTSFWLLLSFRGRLRIV